MLLQCTKTRSHVGQGAPGPCCGMGCAGRAELRPIGGHAYLGRIWSRFSSLCPWAELNPKQWSPMGWVQAQKSLSPGASGGHAYIQSNPGQFPAGGWDLNAYSLSKAAQRADTCWLQPISWLQPFSPITIPSHIIVSLDTNGPYRSRGKTERV